VAVTNEWGRLRSVVLCRPEHFALQPINVIAASFIHKGDLPDPVQALREHDEFAKTLRALGVDIVWVTPDAGLPYQVFTRDIGVTTAQGVVLGAFREQVRRGEEQAAKAAIGDRVPIWHAMSVEPGVAFEGGDYMYVNEKQVALGVGARTTRAGADHIQTIAAALGVEIMPVEFDPKFLHLDMIFNVVGERVCTICKDALPDAFLGQIEKWGFETIDVSPEGVMDLNCNLLAIDEGRVVSPARNTSVNQRLRILGFDVIEVELVELLKGGGGPHCMTFPIERAAQPGGAHEC